MAEDLASLERQLASLRDQRALGARRVSHRSGESAREVEFRSDAELAAAIADLERRISASSGRGRSVLRISTSKGFGT